jgi:hypothetical protein
MFQTTTYILFLFWAPINDLFCSIDSNERIVCFSFGRQQIMLLTSFGQQLPPLTVAKGSTRSVSVQQRTVFYEPLSENSQLNGH